MYRYFVILLVLALAGCKSNYMPFPEVTAHGKNNDRLYWLTPEQMPPSMAQLKGTFEYQAKTKAEAEEVFFAIGREALAKGANLVYVERYKRPTTPYQHYIFSMQCRFLKTEPDSIQKILNDRQLALDTCQCAYVYVFRNQYGGGGSYVPMHLQINDEPIGGIANQKGYKLKARKGEQLTLKSSAPGAYLRLDSVSGYKYIHAFSEPGKVYGAPPYVIVKTKNPKYYVEISNFHGRLLAESLFLGRR